MSYPPNKQYPGVGEQKTKSRYGWIRARDCYYAELLGYQWLPLPKSKADFCDNSFTHVLTLGNKLDLAYVLEPDTRVPNFTASVQDAHRFARERGVKTDYIEMMLADGEATDIGEDLV